MGGLTDYHDCELDALLDLVSSASACERHGEKRGVVGGGGVGSPLVERGRRARKVGPARFRLRPLRIRRQPAQASSPFSPAPLLNRMLVSTRPLRNALNTSSFGPARPSALLRYLHPAAEGSTPPPTITKKKYSALPKSQLLPDGTPAPPIGPWTGGLELDPDTDARDLPHRRAPTNSHRAPCPPLTAPFSPSCT